MLTIPEKLVGLLNKPVGVFGTGVSGRAVIGLLEVLEVPFVVYDERNPEFNQFEPADASQHNLIIYSPGFSLKHSWLVDAHAGGCECLSEMDFGALFWKGSIIGVTGTNGKTTLTKLLTKALSAHEFKAFFAGNIGCPLCSLLDHFNDPEAIAVCEVSSFQSEALKVFSADAVLWTNLDEDHLDRHGNLENYFNAKARLIESMRGSICFVGKTVFNEANRMGVGFLGNIKIPKISNSIEPPEGSVFEKEPQWNNYKLAVEYWLAKELDLLVLESVAESFKLPPHRMQRVDAFHGISFWNDSKATNFNATIAGLNGFDAPVIWIGGGQSKGGNVPKFVDSIYKKVKYAFLIGDEAIVLAKYLEEKKVNNLLCETLEEAVKSAYVYSRKLHKIHMDIVFSPGFASFDMFDNYADRGNYFCSEVLRLKVNAKINSTCKAI